MRVWSVLTRRMGTNKREGGSGQPAVFFLPKKRYIRSADMVGRKGVGGTKPGIWDSGTCNRIQ